MDITIGNAYIYIVYWKKYIKSHNKMHVNGKKLGVEKKIRIECIKSEKCS